MKIRNATANAQRHEARHKGIDLEPASLQSSRRSMKDGGILRVLLQRYSRVSCFPTKIFSRRGAKALRNQKALPAGFSAPLRLCVSNIWVAARAARRAFAPSWLHLIPALLLVGCTPQQPKPVAATQPTVPVVDQPIQTTSDTPSPTVKSRVPGGYELLNNQFRVVISDQTGDVTFWGYADKARNICFRRGMYTTLSALPDVPVKGYVEARDDDTWQFIGDDANHVSWRKIYSLQKDVLLVSIMIENKRPTPLDTAICVNGDLPDLRIMQHDPEHFQAFGGYGTVLLEGWNENHNPTSQPALPTLVQSDTFHLKVGQRQSYTTAWMLSQ